MLPYTTTYCTITHHTTLYYTILRYNLHLGHLADAFSKATYNKNIYNMVYIKYIMYCILYIYIYIYGVLYI